MPINITIFTHLVLSVDVLLDRLLELAGDREP